ncbi:hypothetical protein GCM10023078_32690 [Gibbsiella greigii]
MKQVSTASSTVKAIQQNAAIAANTGQYPLPVGEAQGVKRALADSLSLWERARVRGKGAKTHTSRFPLPVGEG